MASNFDRLKKDLDSLLQEAGRLEIAILVNAHGASEVKKALELDVLPTAASSFNSEYEGWYSESLSVVKQLLPDRLRDFREHFESPKNRKELTVSSYRIQDCLRGLSVTRGGVVAVDTKAAVPHFQQQYAILQAAQRRFTSSLFDIRQIVQADLFDTEIDSARELLKKKFVRAAGAIAGVVLEKHLLQVCNDHGLKLPKKNPTINDFNELLKSEGVIDVPQWRHISLLADIRNLCDHNKEKEPTGEQVGDLLDGTAKVLKTII